MKCRECGTDIADKALICFRCGASVQEPVTKPYVHKRSMRPVIVGFVVAILVLLGLIVFFLDRVPL
jgi:hypothetical protein